MSTKPKHAKIENPASAWATQRAESARQNQAALAEEAKRLGEMAYDIGDIMDGIDVTFDPRPAHERRQGISSAMGRDGRYRSPAYMPVSPTVVAESHRGGRHRRTAAGVAGRVALSPEMTLVAPREEPSAPQVDPTTPLEGRLTAPYFKPVGNTITTGDPYRPQHDMNHQGVGIYEWEPGGPAPDAKYYESYPYPQDQRQ